MLSTLHWQVVKPLLQERTRKKVQVLQGSGRDELLKVRVFPSCSWIRTTRLHSLTAHAPGAT